MDSNFTATFFAGNRRRLRKIIASETPIVITANGLLQKAGDNTFPFHQDSNFWYLTGLNEPDLVLVMHGADEFLIVPERNVSREAFDGAIDTAALTKISGITAIFGELEGWEKLTALLRIDYKAATPEAAPQYIEQYGMYVNPARSRLARQLQAAAAAIELVDIRQDLARMRAVKRPPELAAIQQAIDITNDSLALLTEPTRFLTYKNEYEIEADLTREFRFRGATGHAFAPIVAGGKRACTLHNVSNEAPLTPGSLVVLDVGAEVSHYAADITRTRVYGRPSARQQQVFDAVLDMQRYALGLLKPGVLLKDYEQAVETYMGTTLLKLKLITAGNREQIRKYYPHATSHFLGLDVHDAGDYGLPLEPNMVLTCEPGIYIPEEGIGVRIEDDILITKTGNKLLSGHLPKSLT